MVNLISDYVPPFAPLPNIAPFTYKDGQTYLIDLDNLRRYINEDIVAFVNTNFTQLGADFATQVNILIGTVNTALDAQEVAVTQALTNQTTANDQAIADLTTYVDDAVNSILDGSVSINDALMVTIITNITTNTRILLDSLYVNETDFTALTAGAGRLSGASLDATYVNESDYAALTTGAGRLSDASLQTEFVSDADLAALVTGAGRLSGASLDATYVNESDYAALVNTGRLSNTNLVAQFATVNLAGTYAARPAANTVPAKTMYFCTDIPETYLSNGTSWAVVGSGGSELASATLAANDIKSTTSTAYVDVPGMSVSFVVGERPIKLECQTELSNTAATNLVQVAFIVNGTQIGQFGTAMPYANATLSFHDTARKGGLTPGSTVTAKLQYIVSAGTGKFGSAFTPSIFQVVTL